MKNFDNWNGQKKEVQKKEVQKKEEIPYFYEREIWYLKMWVNLWVEQDWKWELYLRPVVLLKKFNKYSFYWIPMTSVDKTGSRNHLEVIWFEENKKSFVWLSQMRLFDSKRLIEKKWVLNIQDFKKLIQKIKELFN